MNTEEFARLFAKCIKEGKITADISRRYSIGDYELNLSVWGEDKEEPQAELNVRLPQVSFGL